MMCQIVSICLLFTTSVFVAPQAAQAQARPYHWNVTPQVRPLFDKLTSSQDGIILHVGDSISFYTDTWIHFFRNDLWRDYGIGGDGYYGFSDGGEHFNLEEIDRAAYKVYWQGKAPDLIRARFSGDRHYDVLGNEIGDLGFTSHDGIFSRCRNAAQGLAAVYNGSFVTLYFVKSSETGIIQVRINNQLVASIDSHIDSDIPQVGSYTFRVNPAGPTGGTSSVSFKSADSRWIHLNGIFTTDPNVAGYIQIRMSRGGAGPDDFRLSLTDTVGTQLSGMAPDLIIVQIDWTSFLGQATYIEDMTALLDFYGTYMPGTPIILVTHHAFHPLINHETDMLHTLATQRGHGFINLFDIMTNAQLNANAFLRDVVHDGVHFTAMGGAYFGDYIYKLLRRADCLADWNLDGVIDALDKSEYLAAHQVQDPQADLVAPYKVWGPLDSTAFNESWLNGCQ